LATKGDVSDFFSAFNLMNWAPRRLDQPILPGWQFGNLVINYANSSSPEAEREIVSAHSYGRQIGRLMDAICVPIEKSEDKAAGAKKLRDLVALHAEIEDIKLKAAASKVGMLRRDLEMIRDKSPNEYATIMDQLKQLVADNG
jgi:hypothetical protein